MFEKCVWRPKWTFEKYASEEDYKKNKPYETKSVDGNALLNVGINEIWRLFTGASSNHFDSTNSRIGVGDSTTTTNPATHTDLVGSSKAYLTMESTYPQAGSNEKIIFRGSAGPNDANQDWKEFVVKQNSSGKVLNRLVSDQGTKVSGQTWVVTLEVSLS